MAQRKVRSEFALRARAIATEHDPDETGAGCSVTSDEDKKQACLSSAHEDGLGQSEFRLQLCEQ